ncbi:MAG: hypothetical protein Q9201_002154 [Fulgogasparrea decipioides]
MPSNQDEAGGARASLLDAPLETPHWGRQRGSAFTVHAVAKIHTAPAVVLEALLETFNYQSWNRFVPLVTFPNASTSSSDGRLRKGLLFVEHVDMYGNGRPSGLVKMKLLMTTLEETEHDSGRSYMVVWLGKGYPDWALRSERVHVISPNANGTSTYDVWETFSGPLALLVKLFVGKTLVRRFKQWNKELKTYVEGRAHAAII